MTISRREIESVAALARLELSEDEIEGLLQDIGSILDYVDQLQEVNVDGVEPFAHPTSREVIRQDVVSQPVESRAILSLAPDSDRSMFKVPLVVKSS